MAKFAVGFATIAVVVVLLTHCCHVTGTGDSCMVRRMLKAGVAQSKALQYEQRALLVTMSEDVISSADVGLLKFALQSTRADAQAIQKCILQQSEVCKTSSPCLNGGQCQLALSNTSYVCKCHPDFTGDYCQTPHPAPLDEFRSLQNEVKELRTQLADTQSRTQYLGAGCNLRTLGYKYQSRHRVNSELDEGRIATLSFRKKYTNTVLKLSYSGTIRTVGAGTAARWYFKIDNRECVRPTKIGIAMYQSSGDNTHVPAVLTGICESTYSSTGANIAAGDHMITVHIGSVQGHGIGNPASGWASTSVLEIQEMCPQY
ncbi:uncharacterized protein LOC135826042 isoform X2 [Sycon ciliatum]|uniref:uncharacterized protein LOC135826042 isoform X2 n=1 Tax=Sycon ciliatum TaxID=27933 RepID=UPI0031F621F3